MSGRARLPGGEPRKASQRNTRRAAAAPARLMAPTWRPGDPVTWKDRSGVFKRDTGDGEHSEITLNDRIYRVRTSELR